MDILISIIISGFAVGYATEFLKTLLGSWVSPTLIKMLTTYPLSLVSLWLLGLSGAPFFVYGAASSFVSLVVLLWAAKPSEVTQVISRR